MISVILYLDERIPRNSKFENTRYKLLEVRLCNIFVPLKRSKHEIVTFSCGINQM
jgi:hypothetical protein